jgi:hypothetical protein
MAVYLSLNGQQQSKVDSNPIAKRRLETWASQNDYHIITPRDFGRSASSRVSSMYKRNAVNINQQQFDEIINTPIDEQSHQTPTETQTSPLPESSPIPQPSPSPSSSPSPSQTAGTPLASPSPSPEAPKDKASVEKHLKELLASIKKANDKKDNTKPSFLENALKIATPIASLGALGLGMYNSYNQNKQAQKEYENYQEDIKHHRKMIEDMLKADPDADLTAAEKAEKQLIKKRDLTLRSILQNKALSHLQALDYQNRTKGRGVKFNDVYDMTRGSSGSPDTINDILRHTIRI